MWGRIDRSAPRSLSVAQTEFPLGRENVTVSPVHVPSASDQLAMYTVGSTPCAVGMGVGTITDAYGGPWTRARELKCRRARRGGCDIGTYSS